MSQSCDFLVGGGKFAGHINTFQLLNLKKKVAERSYTFVKGANFQGGAFGPRNTTCINSANLSNSFTKRIIFCDFK